MLSNSTAALYYTPNLNTSFNKKTKSHRKSHEHQCLDRFPFPRDTAANELSRLCVDSLTANQMGPGHSGREDGRHEEREEWTAGKSEN